MVAIGLLRILYGKPLNKIFTFTYFIILILGFIVSEEFLAIVDKELEDIFYDEMNNKFGLDKPNHGIAFSISIQNFMEIKEAEYLSSTEKKGVKNVDYEAIFVIVDKGLSDDVIDSAQSAGAKGKLKYL